MKKVLIKILYSILITVCVLLFFSAFWLADLNGNKGFYFLLFSIFVSPDGFFDGSFLKYFLCCILPTVFVSPIFCLLFLYDKKSEKKPFKFYPFSKKLRRVLIALFCVVTLVFDFFICGADGYVSDMLRKTKIYDLDYVNPDSVKIEFPDKKRNLIYIYSESMETTYFSTDKGGFMAETLNPELYNLAKQNTNFSNGEDVGGWPDISNTSWTTASLIAQSSGVPLNVPLKYIKNATELKGLTTLYDILSKEGYYQALISGSDMSAGGKKEYYENHSVDMIYDYSTAVFDGIISEDYKSGRRFEDSKLFDYAKKVLSEIGDNEKPFSFTVITADTQHIGGYTCEKCENRYEDSYSNTIACSSKLTAEFINWIQEQGFYENTTVIICGDHLNMDGKYFKEAESQNYKRHVYNCIINAPITPLNYKNREFSPMDMFPTTLAAIGCKIKDDRLGLGVNLYSDFPTLTELYTVVDFNRELECSSDYYVDNFIK